MKYAMDWIKGNPLTVVAIVLVVVSLAFYGWVWTQERALKAQMAERQKVISQIEGYMRASVQIPPQRPDDPPETVGQVTINPAAIEAVSQLYQQISQEYEGVFNTAVEINRSGHEPLVEGLFPTPEDPAYRFQARDRYFQAFRQMLGPWTQEAQLPRLDAGGPVSVDRVSEELTRVERDFMAAMTYNPGRTGGAAQALRRRGAQMSEKDLEALKQEKQARFRDLLRERAEKIHIYAVTDPSSADFPFTTQALSADADPELYQLWEAQLELWIQQDIAQAIAWANRTDDPTANVLSAPVKRLLSVEVLPGYVGLQNLGGVNTKEGVNAASLTRTRGVAGVTKYPPPVGGMTGSPDERVSDNFYASPTGRVSNALYDVRHARLSVLIDSQRLPELYEQLSRVNFMTVLETNISGVDEYADLGQNYMYGQGDVVRADMVIETIWLREWTADLMPKAVREYVGLDQPTEPVTPMGPAGGGGGDFFAF